MRDFRHTPEEYPWLAAGDEVALGIELMGEIKATVSAPRRGPWTGLRDASRIGSQQQADGVLT